MILISRTFPPKIFLELVATLEEEVAEEVEVVAGEVAVAFKFHNKQVSQVQML